MFFQNCVNQLTKDAILMDTLFEKTLRRQILAVSKNNRQWITKRSMKRTQNVFHRPVEV